MKTKGKRNVKNLVKGFVILKAKELVQIRGGDEGVPTPIDKDFD